MKEAITIRRQRSNEDRFKKSSKLTGPVNNDKRLSIDFKNSVNYACKGTVIISSSANQRLLFRPKLTKTNDVFVIFIMYLSYRLKAFPDIISGRKKDHNKILGDYRIK